jgi:hypothetical protein
MYSMLMATVSGCMLVGCMSDWVTTDPSTLPCYGEV